MSCVEDLAGGAEEGVAAAVGGEGAHGADHGDSIGAVGVAVSLVVFEGDAHGDDADGVLGDARLVDECLAHLLTHGHHGPA